MALRLLSSILFLQAYIGLSHEVLYSLRASNIAFKDDTQPDDIWNCKEYCVETNTHEFTEDQCMAECNHASPEQRTCIFTCKQEAHPSTPKPWDECNCDCVGNCMHTGPGAQISAEPTALITRPPVSSPTPPSSDYDNVE